MNEIKATYSISNRDYHLAVYYAATFRHRIALKIFVILGAAALLCWLGSSMGFIPPFMLPAYFFLGYLIWLLFTIAGIEHGILKYTKSKDNSLFKQMSVTFSKGIMKIDTPYNGKSSSCAIENLACAFELTEIFLIYFNGEQSIIIPKRALSGSAQAELRSLLLNKLKDRFVSRFGYDNLLPQRKKSFFNFK